MNWRAVAVVASTDLRRRARDRSLIVTGIVGPFALALIISLALGGGRSSFEIGVQDRDSSPISAGITSGLIGGVASDRETPADASSSGADSDSADSDSADSGLDLVVIEPSADPTRVVAADDGPAAVIVIPDGFAASLQGAEPHPLQVVAEDGASFGAEIATAIAEGLAAEVDRTRLMVASALAATDDRSDSRSIESLSTAATRVAPSITSTRDTVGDAYSPASYFAPAMTMFFLFFTLGTGASALIADRTSGVLDRMRAAPVGDAAIILGRAAAVVGLGLMSTLTLFAVSGPVMGADWGPPIPAVLVIVCVVLAISGLAMLVMAFARTESQVSGATSILGFGMALIGGTFFSTADLPGVLGSLSLLTPNGLAQRGFTELALGTSLVEIWWVPLGLLAMASASGAVALIAIRRRVLT